MPHDPAVLVGFDDLGDQEHADHSAGLAGLTVLFGASWADAFAMDQIVDEGGSADVR